MSDKRNTTTRDLRDAGWIVRDAAEEGAIECTTILAQIPFHYWRRSVEPGVTTWSPSRPIGDMHGLILAGDYTAPDKVLPFDFLYSAHCADLVSQDGTIGRAKYAIKLAEDELARLIKGRATLVEINKL